MNTIPGLWPGVIASYDPDARTCRVSVPGITDGSTDFPEAITMPSIGDRPVGDAKDQTEIRLLAGDAVWLMFEGGDPRFPVIMGHRTPRAGNPSGWRRWHHANIEMTAEGKMILNATDLVINTATTTVNGQTTVNGVTAINGNTAVMGTLQNNGGNVGSTHTHDDPQGGTVGPPH